MMEIQDQLYIVSGALGGISILLIIATFVLFSRVSKLRNAVDRLKVDAHKSRNIAPLPKQEVSLSVPASVSVPTPTSQHYCAVSTPVTSTAPLLQPSTLGNLGHSAYNSHGNTASFIERERDLTAGGVRVLPTLYKSTDAQKKLHYDPNTGYN